MSGLGRALATEVISTVLRALARWEAGDCMQPGRWPFLRALQAAGPEAPHLQGLDYHGFSLW